MPISMGSHRSLSSSLLTRSIARSLDPHDRDNAEALEELKQEGEEMVTPEDGRKLAEEIDAVSYVETSVFAKEKGNVKTAFDECVKAYFAALNAQAAAQPPKPKRKFCVLI
jgi:hypothetical protein